MIIDNHKIEVIRDKHKALILVKGQKIALEFEANDEMLSLVYNGFDKNLSIEEVLSRLGSVAKKKSIKEAIEEQINGELVEEN